MFERKSPRLSIRAAVRRFTPVAAIALWAALGPAPAGAETITIGNSLAGSEVTLGLCFGECTVFQTTEAGTAVASPISGKVTSWSYRSGAVNSKYRLEVLHPTGGGSYALSGESPQITVENSEQAAIQHVTLATPLAIAAGDSIGLHTTNAPDGVPTSGVNNPGDEYGEISPDAPGNANFATKQQILVQATVTSNPPEGEGGPPTTTTTTSAPPPPIPQLTQASLSAKAGPGLLLSAAATQIPAGTTAASYTFQLGAGGTPIKCPGQDPVLNALVANSVSASASVTVTTAAGASASTSIPVSTVVGKLAKLKVGSSFGKAASTGALAAGQQLGQIQALASECLPATGNPKAPGSSPRVGGIHIGETAPTSAAALAGSCFDAVTVGIIQGVGCFTKVDAEHPLPQAEAALICKRYRFGCLVERLQAKLPPVLFESERGNSAHAALDPGELAYDGIYYSTQPVRIDGVEVDPVNGGAVVLARAGLVKRAF